jgi:hypothetical protein
MNMFPFDDLQFSLVTNQQISEFVEPLLYFTSFIRSFLSVSFLRSLFANISDLSFLNSQTTEQASLFTVASQHSFQVSAVLTCFCDSFASLGGTKCC